MTLILALILAPCTLLTICFAVEIFAGLAPLPRASSGVCGASAVIVVPAHDEEPVIANTLVRLKEGAGKSRILVVADNCTDATAAIARQLGVAVIERSDPDLRGKGFALGFAREHLKASPPQVVVIVDADCAIDAKSISALVQRCAALGMPCQATNLQQPSPQASVAVQLSTFAFFIKNVIRERALQRLAGRVHLLGTGMALPWSIFSVSDLASASIVEDLKLGLELAEAGHAPILVEEAEVWSNAETDSNTLAQRRRWEGGFIANAVSVAPAMFARAVRSLDLKSLWAAIDLMIPPFALLLLIDVFALFAAAALSWLLGAHLWPIYLLSVAIIGAGMALGLAWANGGSRFIGLGSLLRAPLYVAWKLPMYLGLAKRGAPTEWQRTARK